MGPLQPACLEVEPSSVALEVVAEVCKYYLAGKTAVVLVD
jgi:hypothetical protein